jgi:hypothetical protein
MVAGSITRFRDSLSDRGGLQVRGCEGPALPDAPIQDTLASDMSAARTCTLQRPANQKAARWAAERATKGDPARPKVVSAADLPKLPVVALHKRVHPINAGVQ